MCLLPSCRSLLLLAAAVWLAVAPLQAQSPVGEVFSSDVTVKGSVMLAGGGMRVMSGSSVVAGAASATLRLTRGGEVRVCRGTDVAVSSSPGGRELLFSLNRGALETHYSLAGGSTDSILTPDFQIALAGPGAFHFAISADEHGNTCVQALPSSTRPVKISEIMGEDSYLLQPGEQAFFRAGKVSHPGSVAGNCGCPAPAATQRAQAEPPKPEEAAAALPPVFSAPSPAGVTAPPPPQKPGAIHVEVDAPFIFRATDPLPAVPVSAVRLQLSSLPVLPGPEVLPPEPTPAAGDSAAEQARPAKPKKKGFWARLKAIFGG